MRRWTRTSATAIREARHPQRAADLHRADRHDLALRRQRVRGIEPVFAYAYTRKVLQPDGSRTEEEVAITPWRLWREKHGDAPLPDHFVNAQTLPPLDHVRMQAAAQKWVDSSISKTINCPEDISFDAFKEVYMAAWDQGCKGCTTYRPNDVTGSVLTVSGNL
jgi:ribonucleoside-diphosphate reductase alpha chain